MLPCIKTKILPLIHTLNYLGNVKMIYQDLTSRPDKEPLTNIYGSYNSYLVGAMNYYTNELLRSAGVTIVRTWGMGLPWCDDLIGGRVHIVWTDEKEITFTPHGRVATDFIMYHACM